MTQESVKSFLYETFGYAKISEVLEGKKNPDISLREHLKGTIVGTLGRRASQRLDREIHGVNVPAWSRSHAIIPQIFSSSDLEEQIKKGKSYLDSYHGEDILRPEIQRRSFFLSTFTVFVGYTGKGVKQVTDSIHNKEFPEAEYQFSTRGRFKGHIKNNDFYLFTEGSNSKEGGKSIVLSLNLPEQVVVDLNKVIASYNHLMKGTSRTNR